MKDSPTLCLILGTQNALSTLQTTQPHHTQTLTFSAGIFSRSSTQPSKLTEATPNLNSKSQLSSKFSKSLIFLRGKDNGPEYEGYIIFLVACIFLTSVIIVLSWMKYKRVTETQKKFRDIKELEQDFDVYVSDEFQVQQNDLAMQMDFIKQSAGFEDKAGIHAMN